MQSTNTRPDLTVTNVYDVSLQKIENHKLEWKAEAKTVTRNPNYAPPSKSEKKVNLKLEMIRTKWIETNVRFENF